MNKFKMPVLSSVLALCILSSCGDYGENKETSVIRHQTVPSVTFQTYATTSAITQTETVVTKITEPPDGPKIIKVSSTGAFSDE
ncbi:MAG: hypothetical protein ACI4K5_01055, partial [Ruminococcus sp.]